LLEVRELTPKEKLFTLRFIDPHLNDGFTYKPGQFVMVDLRGFGEFPISICSTPTRKGYIQLCVRKAGRLTKYMHELREGDVIGIRGPYGNGFLWK
jgi:2-polyprenylphenol hydroxylase and related flavodoxin oxidoreductases